MKQNLSILSLLMALCYSGNATGQTYNSSGPVTITAGGDCPDLGNPGNSVINVPGTGTIGSASDVFIKVNINTFCIATTKLVLKAPNGDSCILLNMPHRIGPCNANICAMTDPSNTLTFNSTYTSLIPEVDNIPSGNYAPTGSPFAPQVGNLNTFLSGRPINGNWSLIGSADAGGNFFINSWSIVFGSTALPVDLLGFSGLAHTGYNELQWSTASEKNTASFEIQRNLDGNTYQTIGTIAAKGSGSNHYSFRDQNAASGANLYRLRSVDISGAYAYSKTVKISGKSAKDAGIEFAPNPVKDVFTVMINNKNLLNTDAKIINSLGQIVHTFKIDQENIQHNIGHLPAGVYFLRLNDGNHYRFVKAI